MVVFKSFFKLKFNLLEVRNKHFLMGHDDSFFLLFGELVRIDRSAELFLFLKPAFTARFYPIIEEFLSFCISFNEDVVFVKFQIMHSFYTSKHGLDTIEFGESESLRFFRISCGALPRNKRPTGLKKAL